jgi:hypothetical protein
MRDGPVEVSGGPCVMELVAMFQRSTLSEVEPPMMKTWLPTRAEYGVERATDMLEVFCHPLPDTGYRTTLFFASEFSVPPATRT